MTTSLFLNRVCSRCADEFARAPDAVHSLYGRNPDGKLRYTANMQFGEVAYAIVSAALLPKRLGHRFFEYAPLATVLTRNGHQYRNEIATNA